uniref:TATA box-binding protein-associated factor RNA polymerase I subunit A isoform X2 n=1 Tax=Myxine glutinosa TaxID=7769 RepID=UPI0035901192
MESEISDREADDIRGVSSEDVPSDKAQSAMTDLSAPASPHCLIAVREALQQRNWADATEAMVVALSAMEKPKVRKKFGPALWKAGAEIMLNHPSSDILQFGSFAERMKSQNTEMRLKVSLEHALALLHTGRPIDARNELLTSESFHGRDRSSGAAKRVYLLLKAYRASLDHEVWQRFLQGSPDDLAKMKEMQHHFKQALPPLEDIVKWPGIWDVFLLKYVEMLEFEEKWDKARVVLEDYTDSSKFPSNPNAYVYLYDFLMRHDAPTEQILQVLRGLQKMVPSHKLALNFTKLLYESTKEVHQKESLMVLFSLLDFSCWKSHCAAWTHLAEQLQDCQHEVDRNHWIEELWKDRHDWWPEFHFHEAEAVKDVRLDRSLAKRKACSANILIGRDCAYVKMVKTMGPKKKKKARR